MALSSAKRMAALPLFTASVTHSLFLCFLLFTTLCGAESPTSDLLVHKNSSSEDVDLVSFLQSKSSQHDIVFMEAVQLLESMRSSPSCNRMAASELVTSCQSIGGKAYSIDPETYMILEHTRSLYAARLAICELNGAGTSIPPACLPVTIQPPQKKRIFGLSPKNKFPTNGMNSISSQLLEPCLKSLESRPQWWTSYSNSRQNAFIICQAARIEIEKEEILNLHRSVVESSKKLDQGLQEALRTAAAESSQHRAFVHEVEIMNARVVHDIEETRSYFKAVLENVFYDIETRAASVVSTVVSVLGGVQAGATALDKNIQNVSAEVNKLQYTFRGFLDEMLSRSEQVTLAHQQNAVTHNELALSLRFKLESLLQDDITKLFHNVEAFDTSLEWLSGRFRLLSEQELSISERLRDFETSLKEFQLKAESLQKVQLQQSEAVEVQSRLQERLQNSIRISQVLLDKVSTTTANLQVMIDETAARYKGIPNLGPFLGAYSSWAVFSLLLSLIVSHNVKVALLILTIIGVFCLMTTRIL
ncbi:hypothetical protein BDV28DRAFT_126990 [Aspergillus coremiiformis]|uniref:Nuclear fusion protein KAR5 n=1 Tax=Aspergillus coremiiformis TaxID=138285 RepID=A0A5N6ZGC1_9EURO|nr:hypothetical protein BDV28DRAFT_126990 [Aspergillus coremiiformis]